MVDLQSPPTLAIDGVLESLPKSGIHVLIAGVNGRPGLAKKHKSATFELGFAIALLYEVDFIFPQLVIDDFARQHHGLEGIRFMLDNGDSFPRADVIGIRRSTGSQDQLFMKQVDLAQNLHCFAKLEGLPDTKLDFVVLVDEGAESWQKITAQEAGANELLNRSVQCFTTNLTNLDKIMERVRSIV